MSRPKLENRLVVYRVPRPGWGMGWGWNLPREIGDLIHQGEVTAEHCHYHPPDLVYQPAWDRWFWEVRRCEASWAGQPFTCGHVGCIPQQLEHRLLRLLAVVRYSLPPTFPLFFPE